MKLEAIRLVSAALSSGTYGVAVKLDQLETDGNIEVGEVPADPTILDTIDSDPRARSHDFTTGPVLLLGSSGDELDLEETGPSQQVRDDVDVPLSLRYIRRAPDTPSGRRDSSYTVRAAMMSIMHLADVAPAGDRLLHEVGIIDVRLLGLTELDLDENTKPQPIDELTFVVRVRDTSP